MNIYHLISVAIEKVLVSKYLFANKKIYNWVTEIKKKKKVANRAY